MAGKKRASPGADEEKDLFDVQISNEMSDKLKELTLLQTRTELALEREGHKKMVPIFSQRRSIVKTIPKFWPIALLNSPDIAVQCQHSEDKKALSYLEDLWVERDPKESRAFTIEFYFAENPYFTDRVLKKEYKYVPPSITKEEVADENGITDSMVDFDWERDIKIQKTSISWKAGKSLVTQYPRVNDEDGDLRDAGSFFNYFIETEDFFDMGLVIATTVFNEGIEFFLGRGGDGEMDSEMEEDSEEDDDEEEEEEEIDLEKPKMKKMKAA